MTSTTATPLPDAAWNALEAVERRLYAGQMGCNGWTDVNYNEGDVLLQAMWSYAEIGSDSVVDGDETHKLVEVAARVALALATLAFGPDVVDEEQLDPAFVREIADELRPPAPAVELPPGPDFGGTHSIVDSTAIRRRSLAVDGRGGCVEGEHGPAALVCTSDDPTNHQGDTCPIHEAAPVACAECGHLHYFGSKIGYGDCPIEGCPCGGQDDAGNPIINLTPEEEAMTEDAPIVVALREERDSLQAHIEIANGDVASTAALVEKSIADVRVSVAAGTRVPSAVSGGSFFEKCADDVVRAIAARQRVYDDLATIEALLRIAEATS